MSNVRLRVSERQRTTALVAGGAGFVGSHLCDRLVASGRDVVCLDNLQTGNLGNVAHLMQEPGFRFVRHDICGPLSALPKVDEIYNLACAASPPRYQADPIHTMKTSVVGTMNLLDRAVSDGARFLMASTSEVYGDPTVHPQHEGYRGNVSTTGPRACYDEGKRAAETLCYDYHRVHGLSVRVARIFNTYGPRMDIDDGRVVSQFIAQALRGEPLTVYGAGDQTRSFCYVDDLVSGLTALMWAQAEPEHPVNLGNPNEMTVLELGALVLKMTGSRSEIEYRDLPTDDPRQRRPDIAAAARLLSWKPEVALFDGLTRTVDYFREVVAANSVTA